MLYGIAGMLGALAAGACMFAYAPPYSWLADLSISLFGTNVVALSFLGTFVVTAAPFALIARVLEKRFLPSSAMERRWRGLDRFLDTWPGKLVMVGLAMAGVSGYLGYRDVSRGPLVTLDVRALERGEGPSSAYVELEHAELVWDGRVRFDDGSVSSFVPVVSRASAARAAVFAKFRHGIDESAPLRGTLDRDDLPGEVRSAYEDADVIAEPHWVLDVGADPQDRLRVAMWMGAGGLSFAIAGMAIGVMRARA